MAPPNHSTSQDPVDLEAAFDILVCQTVANLENGEAIDVTEICAESPELAPRLRQLLPALEAVTQLRPVSGTKNGNSRSHLLGAVDLAESEEEEPTRGILGDFRILRELGRGGMGVVYEAEQVSLSRPVALKVLPFAAMLDETQLKRFKNEARAAATLKHPHIVSVYSVGCDRGVHYYAMELVDGESLDRVIHHCRDERSGVGNETSASAAAETVAAALSTKGEANSSRRFRTLARLGAEAADALHHAHQVGIIHRDIKPANLIIDLAGKLWITDFGLARIEADAGLTMSGDMLGTLRYMSPEQALGPGVVDHRTDVYSLGVTLYELATLEPAYGGTDRQHLLHEIATTDPPSPRQLNSRVPTDLETIIRKAIERDAADRYRSAQEFADDLRRFMDSQPIHARAPSIRDRFVKWSRRHTELAWAALGVLLLVITMLSIGTVLVARSRNEANEQRLLAIGEKDNAIAERNNATEERNKARQSQYNAEIVAGQMEGKSKNISRLRAKLAGHLPLQGEPDRRGWEWYYLKSLCHLELRTMRDEGAYPLAAWSPDGALIGTPGKIWDSSTYECIRNYDFSLILRYCVAWSPDGRKFAWGATDDDNAIYIWNREANTVDRLTGHKEGLWGLDWSPDGTQLASCSIDFTVKIWDVATRTVVRTMTVDDNVTSVAWSSDGKQLFAGVDRKGVFAWDPLTGVLLFHLPSEFQHTALCRLPGNERIAVVENDRWYLFDTTNRIITEEHPLSRGHAIACSPDGQQIAVTHGEAVSVWDVNGNRPPVELNGHLREVLSVAWSPDGGHLVTSSDDYEIKVWDLSATAASTTLALDASIDSIKWGKDNATLTAINEAENTASTWRFPESKSARSNLPMLEDALCYSSDRRFAAVYSEQQHAISIVETNTKQEISLLRLPQDQGLWPIHPCKFSRDASRLVTITSENRDIFISCWDIGQERCLSTWNWRTYDLRPGKVEHLTWSADGAYVCLAGHGDVGDGRNYWTDHLHVIDVSSGKRVLKRIPAGGRKLLIGSVALSPSDKFIAIGTTDGRVEVMELASQQTVFSEKIHHDSVQSLAWHPNEDRLASSSIEGVVKILSATSGQPLLTFSLADESAASLAWSSDGHRLAAGTTQGNVQTWDASRGYEIAAGVRRGELAWEYYDLAHSSTGEVRVAALQEALRHAPDTMAFWNLRGSIRAMLGEFEQAADEFAKLISTDIRESLIAVLLRAECLLAAGNDLGFQQQCQALVVAFAADPVLSTRQQLIVCCTKAPNSSVDTAELVKIANLPVEKAEDQKDQNYFVGISLLRDGQYEEAARILTSVDEGYPPGGNAQNHINQAYTLYFLALARFHLGNIEQSQRLLHEANDHASQSGDLEWNWWDRVKLGRLRDEVTAALAQ